MEEEVWMNIPGWERYYQISTLGRVKSLRRTIINKDGLVRIVSEKILQPVLFFGYEKIKLCRAGNCLRICVHRLVAEAFIPNPDRKPEINHKDRNRRNNNVLNLEWCTHKENMIHAFDLIRKSDAIKIKRKRTVPQWNSKPVVQKNESGFIIKEWQSIMEASRSGFNTRHIKSCCVGALKKHKGSLWAFK